jgi:proline racemase/trans-L-3-hydroxyproline dehydratase
VEGQQVVEVSIANVPSFLYARDVLLQLPGVGEVAIDVAFGGNFFALASARVFGLTIHPAQRSHLIHVGMLVKQAVNATLSIQHPTAPHITTVELTELYEQPEPSRPFTRGVVIFGDGQMDRSPCGIGTSAAMATRYGRGELPLGVEFTNESIIGTRFRGHLVRQVQMGEMVAVEPVVTGTAYITGLQQFVVDPDDPVKYGFTVGQIDI